MVEGLRFRVKDGEFSGGVKVLKVAKVFRVNHRRISRRQLPFPSRIITLNPLNLKPSTLNLKPLNLITS